ncbi:hypothetical protein ACFTWS_34915 [Streptomyces sp. NPDC057027]|uniref:hypothetical protein n=1 Tax=Streptomyces sp. NPDC057027 TaxID=3346004 RepID=UPI00362C057A
MTRTLHLATGAEIPHDRLEGFSPPAVREEPVARARLLPGAVTEDEFGHIHRSGFLHLAVEPTAALRSSCAQMVASTQVSDK